MPPAAISDDELESDGDGPDEIPATAPTTTKAEDEDEDNIKEEDDDDDDEDDDDEEEYRVENILKHGQSEDGSTIYLIKWLGYDKKSDQTWEPIENLSNAPEILEAYHNKIGGPPGDRKPPTSAKKTANGGKRSSSAAFDSTDQPKKRSRKSDGGANGSNSAARKKMEHLPSGSWESEIQRVSSILEEVPGVKGKRLLGYVEWVDGAKTQHPLEALRRKCPQKLLDYYENHLVFKNADEVY